jgi:hypothetical protein
MIRKIQVIREKLLEEAPGKILISFCKIVPEPTSFKTQQNLILDSVTYLPS